MYMLDDVAGLTFVVAVIILAYRTVERKFCKMWCQFGDKDRLGYSKRLNGT